MCEPYPSTCMHQALLEAQGQSVGCPVEHPPPATLAPIPILPIEDRKAKTGSAWKPKEDFHFSHFPCIFPHLLDNFRSGSDLNKGPSSSSCHLPGSSALLNSLVLAQDPLLCNPIIRGHLDFPSKWRYSHQSQPSGPPSASLFYTE